MAGEPTIRDVAKKAGVSTATVSNVLHGKRRKVSTKTRDNVLLAVRELRYRPSAVAQERSDATLNIGVFLPPFDHLPLRGDNRRKFVIDGFVEAALLQGHYPTFFSPQGWQDLNRALRELYDGRCDGAVFLDHHSDEVTEALELRGGKIVRAATAGLAEDPETFGFNLEQGAEDLLQRLARKGAKKVAYLYEPEHETLSQLIESLCPQNDLAFASQEPDTEIAGGAVLLTRTYEQAQAARQNHGKPVASLFDDPDSVPEFVTLRGDYRQLGAAALSQLSPEAEGQTTRRFPLELVG
ncbi:MAG: LacI family DNA-binding transcriptional regulator [Fimbriimonadaceae bacterium]